MSTSALGIWYSLWLRMRWSLAGILAYLAVLAIASHLYSRAGEPVMLATLLLTAAIAHLLQVFTLGPADIGVRASGFPKHMFVLPVTTGALVGWPMLCAGVVHGGLWMFASILVLIPAGYAAPVIWPAALVGAGTAWVQAIGWSPFPTPFARVPALALAITPLVLLAAGAIVLVEKEIQAAVVTAGSAAWMAVAYVFAVRGVSRARAGSDGGTVIFERVATAFERRRAAKPIGPSRFRTAATAQLWHEWRRNASFLPAMVGVLAILLLVFSCSAMINPRSDRTLMFGSLNIPTAATALAASVSVMLVFATTLGQSVGKFDFWGKEEMPTFFAIRPLTTNQYVLLKFTAAAMSTLASCAVLLVFFALWALVEASSLNAQESFVRPLVSNISPLEVAIAIAAIVGLFVVTWRSIATGIWLGLVGRKWVSVVMGAVVTVVMTLAIISGSWVYRTPGVQPHLLRLLPWLLGVLVGVKATAAASTAFALWNSRLAACRTIAVTFGVWLTVAVIVFDVLRYFVPFSWLLVSGVILFVPFTRLAVAPLALQWNRHR